jgi:predicted cobalt transporter CbtA
VEKRLILRGVLVGALAGLLAFVFARIFAEPIIARAINYETARDAVLAGLDKAAGRPVVPAGPDVFSRSLQEGVGIGVGIVGYGAAMGVGFAVAFAASLGRVGRLHVRSLSLLLALGGFLAIFLIPFLKYPANPPSIGHPDTIKQRGALYLLLVVLTLVFAGAAVWGGRKLTGRFGNWNATLIAVGSFVGALAVVMLVLPQLGHLSANVDQYGRFATETPQPIKDSKGQILLPGFPADDLFAFRLYAVGAQLLLWTTVGLVFGPLAERVLNPAAQAARVAKTPVATV